jgi:NitT/TauT family transport system ATP-binding protein
MSERPGRIVEEIEVGLPHRDDPIARQSMQRAHDLMAHLFNALRLDSLVDA